MRRSQLDSATFSASDAAEPALLQARLQSLFPDLHVEPRRQFKVASRYIGPLHDGRKTTTIRYTKNTVECPASSELPVFQVSEHSAGEHCFAGHVRVLRVDYKPFGTLDEQDARRDGFSSACELKTVLQTYYGKIEDKEIVSIFAIEFDESMSIHG